MEKRGRERIGGISVCVLVFLKMYVGVIVVIRITGWRNGKMKWGVIMRVEYLRGVIQPQCVKNEKRPFSHFTSSSTPSISNSSPSLFQHIVWLNITQIHPHFTKRETIVITPLAFTVLSVTIHVIFQSIAFLKHLINPPSLPYSLFCAITPPPFHFPSISSPNSSY